MTEAAIHKAILSWLRFAVPGALVFHPRNEIGGADDATRKANAIINAKAKTLGMLKGIPDLIVLSGGVFVALEVKREGGRLSDDQIAVGEIIEANGGHFAVVRSIDDAREALRDAGVTTREATP